MDRRQASERRDPGERRQPAEALAAQAFSFLAEDGERIRRFLDISGIDPTRIRSAAAEPGFLAGVLEYLGSDEALLLAFAQRIGIEPADIGRAHRVLAGRFWEPDTP